MRFLRPLYLKICKDLNLEIGYLAVESDFYAILAKSEIQDSEFTKENYIPGVSGQTKFYNQLMTLL